MEKRGNEVVLLNSIRGGWCFYVCAFFHLILTKLLLKKALTITPILQLRLTGCNI